MRTLNPVGPLFYSFVIGSNYTWCSVGPSLILPGFLRFRHLRPRSLATTKGAFRRRNATLGQSYAYVLCMNRVKKVVGCDWWVSVFIVCLGLCLQESFTIHFLKGLFQDFTLH